MRQRTFFVFLVSLLILSAASRATDAEIALWRLECGLMEIDDRSYFSDTHDYDGSSGEAVNGCYLIRHKSAETVRYLLWDLGLGKELLNAPRDDGDGWVSSLPASIEQQLSQLGLTPRDIDLVGISHFHGDHIGQAPDFHGSHLLMGQRDIDYLLSRPVGNARRRLAHWFENPDRITGWTRDHDVFGDGSVTILALPGHTPGHAGLLVRIGEGKTVLLSGDLYHYHAELGTGTVSKWNSSRAETLASQDRFERLVKALKPIVVIQHDRADIAKLPPFPEPLE